MNGFIHSKLLNLLKEETVQELLFITSNSLKVEKDLLAIDWEGSEDDENDEESVSANYK
jgi:hypothetical protein